VEIEVRRFAMVDEDIKPEQTDHLLRAL